MVCLSYIYFSLHISLQLSDLYFCDCHLPTVSGRRTTKRVDYRQLAEYGYDDEDLEEDKVAEATANQGINGELDGDDHEDRDEKD